MLKTLKTSQPGERRQLAERLAQLQAKPAARLRAGLVWAAAAAILVLGWSTWYARRCVVTPLAQLAQAYSSHRTIDLRIPGANYAPLNVERSRAVSRAPQLIKSVAAIERRFASHHPALRQENWRWLHARGRAKLLEWDYEGAIKDLCLALDLSAATFGRHAELLVDLATAYYERAQASYRPFNYSISIDYLSKAIELDQALPVAYFNRAIVLEKQFDDFRAAKDWKQYLDLDREGPWAMEARTRLASLDRRMQAAAPSSSTPHHQPTRNDDGLAIFLLM